MSWNEPGGDKNKDPWSGRNEESGPPDLDEAIRSSSNPAEWYQHIYQSEVPHHDFLHQQHKIHLLPRVRLLLRLKNQGL
jgi:hypothetical protein